MPPANLSYLAEISESRRIKLHVGVSEYGISRHLEMAPTLKSPELSCVLFGRTKAKRATPLANFRFPLEISKYRQKPGSVCAFSVLRDFVKPRSGAHIEIAEDPMRPVGGAQATARGP